MAKLAETEIYGKLTVKSDAAVEGTLDVDEDVTVNGVSVVTEDDARLTDTRNPKSHTHPIANVNGLQTALDAKSASTHNHSGVYEPVITKGTAFNKNFGTASGTVCQGNDTRLTNARTPTTHTHTGSDVTSTVANATTAASCTGNAATATKLSTARKITLSGDVTGSTTFDGSGNKTITTVVADDSHNHIIGNVDGLQAALDGKSDTHTHPYEPAFTKSTAFNKNFGTTSGTVCQGNDARLSDTRTPKAHTHAGTDVTSVVATATSSGTCTGNAASATKLAIARTLSLTGDCSGSTTFDGTANKSIAVTVADDSHNHVISNVDGLQTALDDKADLDETGKIVASQLPALAITNVFVVNSEEAQLALTVEEGDVCIRTDINRSYFALNDNNLSLNDWAEMLTPGGGVLSVNGLTGAVTLTAENVGAATTSHQHNGGDITSVVASATNADTLDGYHASITANAANTIPIRDANGYLQLGWINTTSGTASGTPTRIYCSQDTYIRYYTPAQLSAYLTPNLTNVAINGDKNWNGKKITNLATPTATTDAATKAYVDGLIAKVMPYRPETWPTTTLDWGDVAEATVCNMEWELPYQKPGSTVVMYTVATSGYYSAQITNTGAGAARQVKLKLGDRVIDSGNTFSPDSILRTVSPVYVGAGGVIEAEGYYSGIFTKLQLDATFTGLKGGAKTYDLTGKWLALGLNMQGLAATVKIQGVEIPYSDYVKYFPLAPSELKIPGDWGASQVRPVIKVYNI